ncbi:Retrotransposon gag protein [Abeliophyllum distichum]|uniref:Retrotransposon gag protein n=1 Tax=Abeliophyllum distichum TaxID=126358 RepID=A0ABD1UQ17_9LAMI
MLTQKIESALTKRKDKRRQMVLEEDPFAPEIMAVPLPKGFKQSMIESYDGVTDPLDHLRTFVDMMRLYAAPDALSQSFVAYFLSSKRKRKTAIGLMQVIQEKEETLQDYLARFSRATLGIKDLQMSAVVTAIMNGTRNRSFKMSLSKNPPESMLNSGIRASLFRVLVHREDMSIKYDVEKFNGRINFGLW